MSDEVGQGEAEGDVKCEAHPNKWIKLLIGSVTLLPILGYFVGNSYHIAYLRAFGVDTDSFILPVQTIYIRAVDAITYPIQKGFIALFELSLSQAVVIYLIVAVYMIPVAAKLFNTTPLGQRILVKLTDKLPKLKGFNIPDTVKAILFLTTMPLLLSSLLILLLPVLFSVWLLGYYFGQYQGQAFAEEHIEKYQEHNGCFYKKGAEWSNCKQLIASDGKTILQEGVLVIQVDKRVAFYNGKHSVILEIPEGASIRNVVNAELLEE
jgi:hypothetical protein